jgi:hypothetical protein
VAAITISLNPSEKKTAAAGESGGGVSISDATSEQTRCARIFYTTG